MNDVSSIGVERGVDRGVGRAMDVVVGLGTRCNAKIGNGKFFGFLFLGDLTYGKEPALALQVEKEERLLDVDRTCQDTFRHSRLDIIYNVWIDAIISSHTSVRPLICSTCPKPCFYLAADSFSISFSFSRRRLMTIFKAPSHSANLSSFSAPKR